VVSTLAWPFGVLAEEVPHAEAGQRFAAAIAEQLLRRGRLNAGLREERAEDLDRPRPERADPLFATLATQSHLERTHQLEIGRPHVENLLNTSPGVEQRQHERVIATAIGAGAIGRIENGGDLASLEILYETRTRSFERHGKDSLAELKVLGMIRGGEACERMNGGQAGVSRRCCIVTILLEVSQERAG
jgi:hypothetical protein